MITYGEFFSQLTPEELKQPMLVDLSNLEENVQEGDLLRLDKDMFYWNTTDEDGEELPEKEWTQVPMPKGTILIHVNHC